MVVLACLELSFCIFTVIVETEDVLGCLKCCCGKDNFRCVTNKQTQIISDLFLSFQKFLRLRSSAWFFWWG